MPLTLGRITVATDGSAHGEEAVRYAIDLTLKYSAQLSIIAVAPLVALYSTTTEPWIPPAIPEGEVDRYRQVVDAAVAQAETAGVTSVTGVCLEGVVVDEILSHVDAHPPDLLILGSRGLSTAKRLFVGSTSEAVLHQVKVPVLLVRRRVQ